MTKRITVTVTKETKKALLVTDGVRTGWIQRRWLRAEDSTVSAETFEKSATHNAEVQARHAAFVDYKNAMQPLTVVRETEKAVAIEFSIDFAGSIHSTLAWFPKSCCEKSEAGYSAPGWMVIAKQHDAEENFSPRGYYERHRMCKGERAQVIGTEFI